MTKPPNTPIRVAMLDDHTLLRELLKGSLNAETDIEVVGEASRRQEGLAMINNEKPTVVLLDICLGNDDGLEILRYLKLTSPHIKCLITTGFTEDDFILEAIQSQADGYLLKNCSTNELINAIRQVANGHKYWDEFILRRLTTLNTRQRHTTDQEKMCSLLSPGEKEISRLVAEGMTNSEIGQHVHLAEKTIRNRISLIMGKLDVPRRSKLAALYTEKLGLKKKASKEA